MKVLYMTKEILIYGLPKGETRDYMEDLLACFQVTDKAAQNVEAVKAAASAQGFHSFRVVGFVPGTKPNFAKAVNI
jgi:hypothetical protein